MLESDSDVGYFDAFDSPEDMAKYAEVFKKQADVDAVAEKGIGGRNAWVSAGWRALERSSILMFPRNATDRLHFRTERKCEFPASSQHLTRR